MLEKPPPAGAVDAQVVPLEVRTFPDVLGAITCKADVPLPSKTLFAVKVAEPVPPLATGNVPVTFVAALTKVVEVVPVPPFATAKVPARVIAPVVAVEGVNPVEPALKLETPPAGSAWKVGAAPELAVKTYPAVPAAVVAKAVVVLA
jgi:hypothetical protein